MLTPMDIQEKKFHVGLGYDKKDVNTFFEEVTKSYEKLYRANAELKEQLATLGDELQHYKSREKALEKTKLLAEKDSEDKKSKASREAKNIELEAKNKAQAIIGDAEEKLLQMQNDMVLLESNYAAYKSQFCALLKKQFEFLKENDYDVDAYIDERFVSSIAVPTGGGAPSGNDFGSFSGDPQMRDESTLGGMSAGSSSGMENATKSDSSVYTSNLGANENFVDPFNPDKKDNRFNPFSNEQPKKSKNSTSFRVSTNPGDKNKVKRTNVNSSNEKKNTQTFKEVDVPTIKTK